MFNEISILKELLWLIVERMDGVGRRAIGLLGNQLGAYCSHRRTEDGSFVWGWNRGNEKWTAWAISQAKLITHGCPLFVRCKPPGKVGV